MTQAALKPKPARYPRCHFMQVAAFSVTERMRASAMAGQRVAFRQQLLKLDLRVPKRLK